MSATKSEFLVKSSQMDSISVMTVDRCRVCEGKLLLDPEGEMVCGSCGVVNVEEIPLEISPYNRSPMNHGVIGKNLGTSHKETYLDLQRVKLGSRGHRLVYGAISPWDLESIDEPDSIIRNEIMWFTNLALKRGFTDVHVDPLARRFRSSIKNIQVEEEKEMRKRLRIRLSFFHPQFEQEIDVEVENQKFEKDVEKDFDDFLIMSTK